MNVSKKITIDLNNPRKNVVHLGQGDNQHQIVLTLLKDGMPFDVSEGIGTATLVAGVQYIKANGVPGYYDWTSTDMTAVTLATGTTNVWNVLIDEHATDVAGFAEIFVKFSLASGETLYSFPITLNVIRISGGTTDPDKPYYHSTSFLLAGAQAAKTPAMTFPVGVDGDGKLWVASSASVVCNITLDDDEYVCDVSFSDLTDAIEEHKTIECLTPEGLAFCQGFKGTNYYLITFTVQTVTNSELSLIQYQYDEDGSIDRKVFSASSLTNEVKTAFLNCFAHVAWSGTDGEKYYNDLFDALYPTAAPTSITAVYTQSGTVYTTTSLDALKDDLVVTVHYSDDTSQTTQNYTLSGTLTAGTSAVTVTYSNLTTTFNVTVTASPVPSGYTPVEYIERPIGSGTSGGEGGMASTGLKLSGSATAVIKMGVMCLETPSNTGGYFLSCRQTNYNNTIGFAVLVSTLGSQVGTFDGQTCYIEPEGSGVSVVGKKYDLEITKTTTGMTVTDGTNTNSVTGTPRAMYSNLYVFACYPYSGTSLINPICGRIYYLNIVDGDEEKLDYVPCVRDSDNAAGFWNTVSSTFVTSTGFVAGPAL